MFQQRSDEWYEERRGKATSSCIHKLLGIKGLGETGKTYAFEMAVEIVEGIDFEDGYVSFDMQTGIDREPLAFDKFKRLKSLNFLTVKESTFKALGMNTGGTPDGEVSDNSGLEIKCPKAVKFFRIVANGISELDQSWKDQAQHQMWVFGFKQVYFFVYTIYNGEEKWHEIIIHRDEERIDLIKKRLDEWVLFRDEYVELIKSNRQYD